MQLAFPFVDEAGGLRIGKEQGSEVAHVIDCPSTAKKNKNR
jgi:hypothetical protein